MNNRALAIMSVIVLAICGAAVWFLQSNPEPPLVLAKPEIQVLPPIEPTRSVLPESSAIPRFVPEPDSPERITPEQAVARDPAPPQAEWEKKIDQILRSSTDESQTAQMLINILPGLPAEGQADAAQHISNLILDKDYSKVLPLVKNPGLSEEVLDVFVTDLMNREDEVKLPALLEIAKIPNHPHHEEAVTDLQIFLDEDFGQDWRKWDVAMKAYLKKQAAESAAESKGTPLPPGNE